MGRLDCGRAFGVGLAVVLLAGCVGLQNSSMPLAEPREGQTRHSSASWMLPEAKHDDLLYVSHLQDVRIYSFPEGKLVGQLHEFIEPTGECVDAGGNVFVTDYGRIPGVITEYAHGEKKPIARLHGHDNLRSYSCAVDIKTGNLAVTNYYNSGGTSGSAYATVLVYPHGKGKPKSYYDRSFGTVQYCAYDDRGDLFIDGGGPLAELPKGSDELINLSINGGPFDIAGGLQWDHGYLALGYQEYTRSRARWGLYHLSIAGSTATVIGNTPLDSAGEVLQFLIHGHTLISPDGEQKCGASVVGCVEYYKYPSGGYATKDFSLYEPRAIVLSRSH